MIPMKNDKKLPLFRCILISVFFLISMFSFSNGLSISVLRTNGLIDPLGIDTVPVFSWIIEANESRGVFQEEFEIVVGTDKALETVIWNSGKQIGYANSFIYNGPALRSNEKYYWRVIATANVKPASPIESNIAFFLTGILDISEWSSIWIGGYTQLRVEFGMDHNSSIIDHATVFISGLGYFQLFLNGNPVGSDERQNPTYTEYGKRVNYLTYDVKSLLKNGDNAIGVNIGGGWFVLSEGGKEPVLRVELWIHYDNGAVQKVVSSPKWKGNEWSPFVRDDVYNGETFDSRLVQRGWTSDAALASSQAVYNFGMQAFYSSYVDTLADSQKEYGFISNVSPSFKGRGRDTPDPAWTTVYPWLSYQLIRYYDAKESVERHYSGVKAHIEFLLSGLEKSGMANMVSVYGDWVPPPPNDKINGSYTSCFFVLRDVWSLIFIARELGYVDDVSHYSNVLETLRSEFNKVWYDADAHSYGNGSQSELAMALATPSLVPQSDVMLVGDNLISAIEAAKGHVTTGIQGTYALYNALDTIKRPDIMAKILLEKTYPSLGYMIYNGKEVEATTLWELWNSPSGDPEMDSRNHIMFGAVGEWFYRSVVGIKQTENSTAFAHSQIVPASGNKSLFTLVGSAKGSIMTVRGEIGVAWAVDAENNMNISLRIPTSTTSELHCLITNNLNSVVIKDVTTGCIVWKDSSFVSGDAGVIGGGVDGNLIVLELESGIYSFDITQ